MNEHEYNYQHKYRHLKFVGEKPVTNHTAADTTHFRLHPRWCQLLYGVTTHNHHPPDGIHSRQLTKYYTKYIKCHRGGMGVPTQHRPKQPGYQRGDATDRTLEQRVVCEKNMHVYTYTYRG